MVEGSVGGLHPIHFMDIVGGLNFGRLGAWSEIEKVELRSKARQGMDKKGKGDLLCQ